MTTPPIQILGAGFTGMSAGAQLQDDYQIHEALAYPGGLSTTVLDQGYRFDCTGHLLHLRDPAIRRFVEELLEGTAIRLVRRSKIYSHRVYTRYPYQANTYGLPPQIAFECVYGFLEAAARYPTAPKPEDFEAFCLTHFGDGFSQHFMIPYNWKMWGVHPREITAEWCARFVPLPNLRDVIAGAVGLNQAEMGYNAEFLYPPLGIGQLTEALSARIAGHITYRSNPRAIDWRRRKLIFSDRELPYRALISSAPLPELLKLLVDPPPLVVAAGAHLRCNPLWYLDVALTAPAGSDLHWAYVPEKEYPFYRVGCYSNFSPQMAPAGTGSLYVELASRERPILAQLMPEVARGLVEMGIIKGADRIAFARLKRMDYAYVVFDHQYYASLQQIQSFLAEQAIIACGRYGGWNYSSMEDAIIAGRDAASKAREISQ
jgi:protoporphyrinogen oxidase